MVEPLAESAPGVTASQRIAEELGHRILDGRLRPGTRITQEDLADEYRTSRIPVREALRILQSRGLVELKANFGAWVAQLSLHDLSMSYRIRERIEPLLLLDSLPRLTRDDVAQMQALQESIDRGTEVDDFLVQDRQFHWVSYRRHQSPELAGMVERLWDRTQAYRREFVRLTSRERSWVINAEHHLLIEAVAAGAAQTAASVLETHIRRTRLELHAHPELFSPAHQ